MILKLKIIKLFYLKNFWKLLSKLECQLESLNISLWTCDDRDRDRGMRRPWSWPWDATNMNVRRVSFDFFLHSFFFFFDEWVSHFCNPRFLIFSSFPNTLFSSLWFSWIVFDVVMQAYFFVFCLPIVSLFDLRGWFRRMLSSRMILMLSSL